jgi:cytochrome c oxidase assembly factor CtaG
MLPFQPCISIALHAATARFGGWSADPLVLLPLIGAAFFYVRGYERLRTARGRGALGPRLAVFSGGLIAIALALQSPLEGYAERSLVLHMVQHIILASIAVPFVLLGRPVQVLTLGLPTPVRRAWADATTSAPARSLTGLIDPWWTRLVIFLAGYLGWHVPFLYEAAIERAAIHTAEHLTFLACAAVFWFPVVQGRRRGRRSPAARIGYLTVAMLATSALGVALIAWPGPWYPAYEAADPVFELSALEEQRLAGTIMWVFDGLIYVGVIAALFGRWLDLLSADDRSAGSVRDESEQPR